MEKSQENVPLAEKGQDRKSNRTRQKNKIDDGKEESNYSPKTHLASLWVGGG